MTSAVILAAGAGTRMGGVAKALLPVGDETFLAHIVSTLRSVGCTDIVVVVGAPFGAAVSAEANRLGARVIVNPDPARGMASSVALGFGALGAGSDAWLWPVDHPHVTAETLRSLIAALGDHEAARPRFEGRGGHPPLVARRAWPQLAACDGVEGGARTVMSRLDVVDVPVQDPGVVRDIDTPGDAR